VQRALGALQRMVGCGQQRFCRGFHRRCALAHAVERAFDARAERRDRRVDDAAPFFPLAQRVAFFFGRQLVRDIGMRRQPAAARHRSAHQRDNAAVPDRRGFGLGAALGDLLEALRHVGIGIAGECARCGALHQELAQRRVARHVFGPQAVHFDVAFIAEHETRGAVEHAQALRHGVERGADQAILGAHPHDGYDGRKTHGDARQYRACSERGGRLGCLSQRVYEPIAAQQREAAHPDGKSQSTRCGDRAPVAAQFRSTCSRRHCIRIELNRPKVFANLFFCS